MFGVLMTWFFLIAIFYYTKILGIIKTNVTSKKSDWGKTDSVLQDVG